MIATISTQYDFKDACAELQSVLHLKRRLPDYVFRKAFKDFAFIEFELMLTEDFWAIIQFLCERSDDKSALVSTVEPDSESYYYRRFRYYGSARISVEAPAADYYNFLSHEPEDNIADALLYRSDIFVCTGSSGQWAVWGERSMGIAIIACASDASLDFITEIKRFDLEEVLASVVALNYTKQHIPEAVIAKFRNNYS